MSMSEMVPVYEYSNFQINKNTYIALEIDGLIGTDYDR